MTSNLTALVDVGVSNWIAIGAFALAAFALWRGERRATLERRRSADRNLVKWSVTWPAKGEFVLTNLGPDDAKNVWIQVFSEGSPGEATSTLMRRGAELSIPMPHLADTWDATEWLEEGYGRERINVVAFGGEVTWQSPNGLQGHARFDSAIQTWREHKFMIL